MKTSVILARLLASSLAGLLLTLASGCGVTNFIHRDSGLHDYSSTGQPTKGPGAKKSWWDKLSLDNLRDERAVEVERHMNGGI